MVQQNIDARQRESPAAMSLEDYEQVRNEVWEQFVQNSVLDAEYRRRGITVSEDEIVDALRTSPPPEFLKIPEFQTDSQFDLAKYQRWLTSSVAQQYLPSLEAQYREQLQRSKLLRVVTADIYLSDAALWEQYRDENEKVKIGLTAIIPRNAVPDSAVSGERRRGRPPTTGPTSTTSPGRPRRTSASWRCPASPPRPTPRRPARAPIRSARRSWAARRSPTWRAASRPTA